MATSGQGSAFTLGHRSGHFAALAFSRDATVIAGVDGRSVVLWDLGSQQELLRLNCWPRVGWIGALSSVTLRLFKRF